MTNRTYVRVWLIAIVVGVFLIMAVGAVTRLKGAGLSIVEWKPISGVLPPLSQEQWQQEFSRYQKFPDFTANPQMSLDDFKFLFWWEYFHRLAGRALLAVILIPLGIFSWQKRLDRKDYRRFVILLGLGAAQGVLGWFMVKSGLVNVPRVSHLRLMAHFLSACMILAYLAHWLRAETIRNKKPRGPCDKLFLRSLLAVCFIQLALGALVAGSRAGYIFNTFPKMGNTWMPAQFFIYPSITENIFYNQINLQFFHRLGGWLLAVGAVWAAWRYYFGLAGIIFIQFLLGIMTLVGGVPLPLAVAHQLLGALLFFKICYSLEN